MGGVRAHVLRDPSRTPGKVTRGRKSQVLQYCDSQLGAVLSHRGHLAMLGDIFNCHDYWRCSLRLVGRGQECC